LLVLRVERRNDWNPDVPASQDHCRPNDRRRKPVADKGEVGRGLVKAQPDRSRASRKRITHADTETRVGVCTGRQT
jgi:hypothetical protein